MADDLIMLSYDAISDIPVLRWLFKILRWYLKKKGKLKDYEDLYKTDNGLRVFSNSLKKIGIDIDNLVELRGTKIPLAIILKQKTKHSKFLRENLKSAGFLYSKKTMGIWLLPPTVLVTNGIKNYNNLATYLQKMIGEDSGEVNIRFGVLTDYNELFTYPPDLSEFKQFITPELIRYFEVENVFYNIQKIKKQKFLKTQADLINSTPLQHMFADFISLEILDKLNVVETGIITELEKSGDIQNPHFLYLKNINREKLKQAFRNNDLFLDDEIIEKGIKQAQFISERIRV